MDKVHQTIFPSVFQITNTFLAIKIYQMLSFCVKVESFSDACIFMDVAVFLWAWQSVHVLLFVIAEWSVISLSFG